VIAHLHARDRGADLLDDARALVAEHHRHRRRERAVADEQVGVADARRHDAHPHLVGLQVAELDVLQREGRTVRLHDGCGDGGGTHRCEASWAMWSSGWLGSVGR
jgi:hypothetical protein